MTIPAGQSSETQNVSLSVADDNIAEGTETIRIGGTLAGFTVAPAVLTIGDNDTAPDSVQAGLTASTVAEGGSAAITTRFPAGSDSLPTDTAVTYTLGGSAGRNSDYRIASLTAVIPAGQTQVPNLTVTIINDTVQEPGETIVFTPAVPDGFTVSPSTLTVTIPANDQPTVSPPPTGGGSAPPPPAGGGGGGAAPPAQPAAQPAPPAAPACVGRFCDEDGSVHQANIERIAQWEITLGCSATDPTLFCPSADITRRQMAAFLYRAVSQRWTIQAPQGVELSDVGSDAWYRTYADWVVSVNAFAAPGGVFNPGGVVTRADMAIMLIAAFPHLEGAEPQGRFQDARDASPAVARALEGMYQTGVTRGCSTQPLRYCPDQPVTRAQMASFFVRAIDLAPTTPQTARGNEET